MSGSVGENTSMLPRRQEGTSVTVTPRLRRAGTSKQIRYLPLALINLATLFSATGNGIAIVVIPGSFSSARGAPPTRQLLPALLPCHY